MKYIFLFATIIFFASCNHQDKKPETIRVSGEGKIRAKPNQVILTLNVGFTERRMVDAVRKTQRTVDSVVAILEKYGDKENDIKTSSISANKEYNWNGRTDIFVGYHAQQTIDFVLNDINKFTELTGKLLETKISSISQIQFGHSKTDSLLREADLLAYDDALKSANKLCGRAGVKLGKLVFMSNTEDGGRGYPDDGYVQYESANMYNKGIGGSGFKISPHVIEFKRRIITAYEINN